MREAGVRGAPGEVLGGGRGGGVVGGARRGGLVFGWDGIYVFEGWDGGVVCWGSDGGGAAVAATELVFGAAEGFVRGLAVEGEGGAGGAAGEGSAVLGFGVVVGDGWGRGLWGGYDEWLRRSFVGGGLEVGGVLDAGESM